MWQERQIGSDDADEDLTNGETKNGPDGGTPDTAVLAAFFTGLINRGGGSN